MLKTTASVLAVFLCVVTARGETTVTAAQAKQVRENVPRLVTAGIAKPYPQHGLALVRKDWWDKLSATDRENTARYLSMWQMLETGDGDPILAIYDTSITQPLAQVTESQDVMFRDKPAMTELDSVKATVSDAETTGTTHR